MFLKEILQCLLFKQSCELCHQRLASHRFFCAECQAAFSLLLSSKKLYHWKGEKIFLHLNKVPHIQVLKQKLQNPRNFFLVDSLVALTILAFHELKLPWPEGILKTSWISDPKINSRFLKKLAKSMRCSVTKDENKSADLILTFKKPPYT